MTQNAVGWFEIAVEDMERAMKFYEAVLGTTLERHQMGDLDMAWFPMHDKSYGAAGSLVKHEMYKPSATGTVVYFTAHSGDLANELGKVADAGGKVLKEKMNIGEHGFIGIFQDSEGNTVALHSMK